MAAFTEGGTELVVKGFGAYKADLTKADQLTLKFGKSTEQVGKQSEKAAKSSEKAAKSIRAVGAAMAVAGAALGAMVAKVTLTAARTQELGIVMESIAKNTGNSIEAIEGQEEAIKNLGITTQVSRKLLIQFMRYQLDTAKATELARLAQDAAVISMQDSSQALEGILHGITTYNVRVLRTYGITINLQQAFKDYADEMGKTTATLTTAEKQQIAMNEVLKNGETIAGTYEAAMGSAGKQLRSMSRHVEELQNELGQHLLPAMGSVVGATTNLLKAMRDLPEPVKATVAQVGALAAGVLTFTGALLLALPAIKNMIAAMRTLQILSAAGIGLGPVGIIAGIVTAAVAAIVYLDNLEKARRKESLAIAESSENYQDYVYQMSAAELQAYALSEALYEQARAAYEAGDAMAFVRFQEAQEQIQDILGEIDQLAFAWETYNAEVPVATEETLDLGKVLRGMVTDLSDTGLRIAQNDFLVRQWAQSQGLAEDQIEEIVRLLPQMAREQQIVNYVTKAAAIDTREHEERMLGLVQAMSAADRARGASVEATERLTARIEKLVKETGLERDVVADLVVGLGYADKEVEKFAEDLDITGKEMQDLVKDTRLTETHIGYLNTELGYGEDAIKEWGDAAQELADEMGIQIGLVEEMGRQMGWTTQDVLIFAASFGTLKGRLEDAKKTIGDVFSAIISGSDDLRDINEEMEDVGKDLNKSVGDIRDDLGGKIDDINEKYDDMLPDKTSFADRVKQAGDVWDEWAFRARAVADGIEGAHEQAWAGTIDAAMQAMGEFRREGESLESYLGRFIDQLYAGELPDEFYIKTADYQAAMAERSRLREEEIADERAKAAEAIAIEKERAAEQQRILEEQRAERGILSALELAESMGALQGMLDTEFPQSLGIMDASAQEVFDAWKNGFIDMEGDFGTFIQDYLTKFLGAMDASETEYQDNAEEATTMFAAAQQGAADYQVALQADIDKLAELEEKQAELQRAQAGGGAQEGMEGMDDVSEDLEEVNAQIAELEKKVGRGGPLSAVRQLFGTEMAAGMEELAWAQEDVIEGMEDIQGSAEGTAAATAQAYVDAADDVLKAWISNSVIPELMAGFTSLKSSWESALSKMVSSAKSKTSNIASAFADFSRRAQTAIQGIIDKFNEIPLQIDVTITITTTYNPTVSTAQAITVIQQRLAALPEVVAIRIDFITATTNDAINDARELGERLGEAIVRHTIVRARKDWKRKFKLAELGRTLLGVGSFFAELYQEETLDPLKDDLDEVIDKHEELNSFLEDQANLAMLTEAQYSELLTEQNRLAQERNRLEAEYEAKRTAVLKLEEQEKQLDLLNQQLQLIRLLYDLDIDPRYVLGELTAGLEAGTIEWMEAMASAIDQVIDEINARIVSRLGIASPSKLFAEYGRWMMEGLAQGVQEHSMLPAMAVGAAVIAPAMAARETTVNLNMGGTTINTPMDQAVFEARVEQAVVAAIDRG